MRSPWDSRAESLLRLAAGPESGRFAALRARLSAADGAAWFLETLEHFAPGLSPADLCARVDPLPGAPQGVDAPTVELVEALRAARDALAHRGAPGPTARALEEDLLELASLVPDPWADALSEVAVRLEEPAAGVELRVEGFEVEALVGSGGMGVVYRARKRSTGQLVALKVLRPELLSHEARERFRREAELLGRLSHPGIAGVVDAGWTERFGARAPYMALEFVHGRSLREHLREATTDAKLATFLAVCDAVAYAHGRGVLHRDLHPGNVLVGADGRPRVVDFGIGRATEEAAPRLTITGQFIGTLAYVPPEQAEGSAADARSDVFSLGATLFELLCGATPHELAGLPLREALARVGQSEPRRLRELWSAAPRDLDVIVGKCLERTPTRRYATVAALAEDVRRFLEHRPIHARPPSALDRAVKFVRRNRRAVAVATVLAATTLWALVGWRSAARESERARLVARAMLDQLGELAEELGSGTLLGEGLRRLDDLIGPEVEGSLTEAHLRLVALSGDAALRHGDLAEAWHARDQVLAGWRALSARNPDSMRFARGLSIALVKVGDLHKHEGRTDQARELYQEAFQIDGLRVAVDPSVGALDDLVWSRLRLGALERSEQRLEAAIGHYEEAMALCERLLAANPARPLSLYARCSIRLELGAALRSFGGRPDESQAMFEDALDDARVLVTREPERRPFWHALISSLCAAGRDLPDVEVAAERLGEAATLAERLWDREPDNHELAVQAQSTLQVLASHEERRGELAEAARAFERAVTAGQRAWALAPENPRYVGRLDLSWRGLVRTLLANGEDERVRALLPDAPETTRAWVERLGEAAPAGRDG